MQTDTTTAENVDLKNIIDDIAAGNQVAGHMSGDMAMVYRDRVVNLEKIFGLSVDDYYYYDVSVLS